MIAEVDSDGDKEINYEGTTCWRHGDGDKEINYEGTTRWRHGDGDKEINYEGTTRWRHALLCSSLLIDVTGSASICVWRRHA